MIFRCQNGRLLNTDHVVEWDKQTEPSDDNEEKHTVTAKTVLDTTVEVFEGAQDECERCLGKIYGMLSVESRTLRHLCDGLAKRDDKLAAAMKRLVATIN